ncbi:hypothetical protein H9L10_04990 [Phycicoccus endophyticus]|uniref:Uncharacterized protein n=1 Tax=Phycicoccus endophyticus TaxID=1690220 RepID=A0A7G9R454_9MICO|nr:hypothetical protein [Phycicoccus endophyticus]QNN50379.1 hypothetical protein H9L10_04990 [Phycicoccus endophyticus]
MSPVSWVRLRSAVLSSSPATRSTCAVTAEGDPLDPAKATSCCAASTARARVVSPSPAASST